jgi:hypothetical protein
MATTWPETIRRAFVVPDLISPENAHLVVARRMLGALPNSAPQWDSDSVLVPFSELIALAVKHVAAFEEAASLGELDLPLCGFGTITGPEPNGAPRVVEAAADTAVGVLRRRLTGIEFYEPWIRWIFAELEKYVRANPHSES